MNEHPVPTWPGCFFSRKGRSLQWAWFSKLSCPNRLAGAVPEGARRTLVLRRLALFFLNLFAEQQRGLLFSGIFPADGDSLRIHVEGEQHRAETGYALGHFHGAHPENEAGKAAGSVRQAGHPADRPGKPGQAQGDPKQGIPGADVFSQAISPLSI